MSRPSSAPSSPSLVPTTVPSAPTLVPTSNPTAPTVIPTTVPTATPVASSPSSSSSSGCFAGSETVHVEGGIIVPISAIAIGDRVLSADETGALSYSDVVYVPHPKNDVLTTFLTIETATKRTVTLTPSHLVWTQVCDQSLPKALLQANQVQVGVCLRTVTGLEEVRAVEEGQGRGVYSVVAQLPYVVVSGVLASPFEKNHVVASAFYNVHRALYGLLPAAISGPWLLGLQTVAESVISLF